MDTLIPPNIDVAIKLTLTSNEKFFYGTASQIDPRFIVSDAKM